MNIEHDEDKNSREKHFVEKEIKCWFFFSSSNYFLQPEIKNFVARSVSVYKTNSVAMGYSVLHLRFLRARAGWANNLYHLTNSNKEKTRQKYIREGLRPDQKSVSKKGT